MENLELMNLKYPIGKFAFADNYSKTDLQNLITEIEQLPELVENEYLIVKNNGRLDIAYRPDGWTARQVVHHISDSHMNALIRVKLTLTEDHPTIKPYIEDEWAKLIDVKLIDPQVSIDLLKGVHLKLVAILRNASDADFERIYFHPESQKDFKLSAFIANYAWHGKHHLGHLRIINNQ